MAKVILRNHWNCAQAKRLFRKGATKKTAVEIPDQFLPLLPSTAVIVHDDYVEPVPEVSPDTLSEHRKLMDGNDPARAAAEAMAKLEAEAQETQENQRRENAAKHQADLAAEEAAKPKKGKKGKTDA